MKISNTKIYEQVADIILESIKSGEYKVGDRLPLNTTVGSNIRC
ncbi:transcriptional regulator [Staphylococcus gallinarum]|uniref:Transcriptional regulator n=1 Tax=Staphylococcus gallinarum TaxID=1293 RepID=A0A380FJM2_STAGA|nr:transcriptional regulator [Staphylococcus gallinarum]